MFDFLGGSSSEGLVVLGLVVAGLIGFGGVFVGNMIGRARGHEREEALQRELSQEKNSRTETERAKAVSEREAAFNARRMQTEMKLADALRRDPMTPGWKLVIVGSEDREVFRSILKETDTWSRNSFNVQQLFHVQKTEGKDEWTVTINTHVIGDDQHNITLSLPYLDYTVYVAWRRSTVVGRS